MGMFGWSYPPGAENHPFAPYNAEQSEMAIVDDPIATHDTTCPHCGETAGWFEGGDLGGWECLNCHWEQEALDEDYQRLKSFKKSSEKVFLLLTDIR